MRWLAVLMTLALTFSACGGSDDGPLTDMGEAACNLRDGHDMQAMANSALRSPNNLGKKRIASAILLGVENECPEFRDQFWDGSLLPEWMNE